MIINILEFNFNDEIQLQGKFLEFFTIKWAKKGLIFIILRLHAKCLSTIYELYY